MNDTESTPPAPNGTDPIAPLREAWPSLNADARMQRFHLLPRGDAEAFFEELDAHEHATLLAQLPPKERRAFLRVLGPDDIADTVQEAEPDHREGLLALLDDPARAEVVALMRYAEDHAGGLMNPRFSSIRADMEIDEALTYLRRRARANEAMDPTYYSYVLDSAGRLLGVISLRGLFAAKPGTKVHEVMHRDVVTVPEEMDQEDVAHLFEQHDLLALPVVDGQGRMKGLVSVDDIVDVLEEEATEDIHKMGGLSEALDTPYLDTPIGEMVRKRAAWLSILLIGEMLTATALSFFQKEIDKATVLALFMPLIISSGGNSGSQASTLVVRAMALGDVRMHDIFRVFRRELTSGLLLGAALAVLGFVRIIAWNAMFGSYPGHALGLAVTVALSLVGVVMFGTLAGSMLPFALRRFGLDPASASAPFVATLVDVTGLIIYFTVASIVLADMLR